MPQDTSTGWDSWAAMGAAPPYSSGVAKASGCNHCILPVLAPRERGSCPVPGCPLWSHSGRRGGNSESVVVLIQASHLLFGCDSHLTHFDLTASCPPAFHCPWSGGCPQPPDIHTLATASSLCSHPLFQASEPVLPVNTSLALRPPHWGCSLGS